MEQQSQSQSQEVQPELWKKNKKKSVSQKTNLPPLTKNKNKNQKQKKQSNSTDNQPTSITNHNHNHTKKANSITHLNTATTHYRKNRNNNNKDDEEARMERDLEKAIASGRLEGSNTHLDDEWNTHITTTFTTENKKHDSTKHNNKKKKNKKNKNKKETNVHQHEQQEEVRRESTKGKENRNRQSLLKKKKKKNFSQEQETTNTNGSMSGKKKKKKARTKQMLYEEYASLEECHGRYAAGDVELVRGTLRVMPGGSVAFVSCDRGNYQRDILIASELDRNRALDGDTVFLQLLGPAEQKDNDTPNNTNTTTTTTTTKITLQHNDDVQLSNDMNHLSLQNSMDDSSDDNSSDDDMDVGLWKDDGIQKRLWNPLVNTRKVNSSNNSNNNNNKLSVEEEQFVGKVIHVVPGKTDRPSELNPSAAMDMTSPPKRTIVGTLKEVPGSVNRMVLLVPNNRSLPRFLTPRSTQLTNHHHSPTQLYRAEYEYGSWNRTDKWAPCRHLQKLTGTAAASSNNNNNNNVVEEETEALLVEHGVHHGDFSPSVCQVVEDVVQSGRTIHKNQEMGWEPTADMLKGRRDYRKERIFTIDPTTARDLDDALHIKQLDHHRVEIGVHIADVSYFVQPDTPLDLEAQYRATTVYLVDRVIPMVPRPLCEVACSLNENVPRLAFSCVWTMNLDGTMEQQQQQHDHDQRQPQDIWYGRTVIQSCARLDYATAQNIIDNKVATGESSSSSTIDPTLWPVSRQPTNGFTVDQVAADVRLMHKVAMARRQLRMEHGALTLNGVKLTFQLHDNTTPQLCQPYPIRDSNKLVEEYMLLANFLVAQKLLKHAGGLALVRHHPPPLQDGLQDVVDMAQTTMGYSINTQNSTTLQRSLNQLGRHCTDTLILQCITEQLMTPMRPAEYIAAGTMPEDGWAHFALNIPYYTHFTSPIRRYADIMVHRLLQATLDDTPNNNNTHDHPNDDSNVISDFYVDQQQLTNICTQCNDMRMNAKKASERSDRVFLSLYLKTHPIAKTLGVVLSIGLKAFTCYVPSLGLSTMIYTDDHTDIYDITVHDADSYKHKHMKFIPKQQTQQQTHSNNNNTITIRIFTKLTVSCFCKPQTPIDVGLRLIGPWNEQQQQQQQQQRHS